MSTEDKPNLHHLRVSYELGELNDEDAPESPFELFHGWLEDALEHQLPEPNAMSLATIGLDGTPNIRTVLLKGVDER
ncbi:MAG: pdxH, partial [Verrucomicrobiaceae bacterium]|nr:pdxH [Verrucomicrobiaceae bacterium]